MINLESHVPVSKKQLRQEALTKMDALPELQAYQDQPIQMKAGAKGKVGILEMMFERKNNKSTLTHLYRVAPLLVQQGLYFDESWQGLPIVPIISVGGGVLQGDRYAIDIVVKDKAEACVTTQSATRIQEMNANYATQFQSIHVGKNAYLEYVPDTTILYKDSRYACVNQITVDEAGVLIYGETVMLGRKHYNNERYQFELFSTLVNIYRPKKADQKQAKCIFSEKLLLKKNDLTKDFNIVMKNYDVFSNVICVLPEKYIQMITEGYKFTWNKDIQLMSGISLLPNQAGVILRVVGKESYHVHTEIKRFTLLIRAIIQHSNMNFKG